MTESNSGLNRMRTPWQRTTTALLCCAPFVATPMIASAQQTDSSDKAAYRLAPVIVNAQATADDDSHSVVAKELWVGGKVATSLLDTPASVSVVTEKEIEQRSASTT
jgi:iron complex outermembrane recepter protein